MFLDAFMNTSESSIPDFDDLQLEYAVSLEAAYNDFMLEGCRLEFQSISENSSVEVLNEGIFDLIKKFFKAIWNFLKKIFGVKGSGGSSGGGGSSGSSGGGSSSGGSTNTKEQKKEAEKLDKELEEKKEEIENMIAVAKEADSMKSEAEEKLKKNMDEAQKKVEKEKKSEKKEKSIQQIRDEVEKQIMGEIESEIESEIDILRNLPVKDPFINICPISVSFFNDLVDKINYICENMRNNVSNIDQAKFKLMQSDIEARFLEQFCEYIDYTTLKMRKDIYHGNSLWHLMDVETYAVQEIISRYKKITAPREDFLFFILDKCNSYSDFKKVIQGIRKSATEELEIDFQAQLDNLSKETMNDIKQDNSYTDADIGSLVARVKMRLITDLTQILAAIGIENKKARLYQLNSIRTVLREAKKLDMALTKKVDVNYLYTEMRKRGVEP